MTKVDGEYGCHFSAGTRPTGGDGLWVRCENERCRELLYVREFENNLRVGDKCQHSKVSLAELPFFALRWIGCEAKVFGKFSCPGLHRVSIYAKMLCYFGNGCHRLLQFALQHQAEL